MAGKVYVNEKELLEIYKKGFNIRIPWSEILDKDFCRWMNIFEKATNCSRTMVMSSLLAMTASVCGPKTEVLTMPNGGFRTTLNQYLISVCDPGGGKSNTFYRVIQPVLDVMRTKFAINLQIETYTTAGIQNHQIMNNGYGLITSDEGHQFLSSVNIKQSKGEAEKSLLCKMWGGRGDSNTLASGNRGFQSTSMSICLFIQPEPLISELVGLKGNDGLLDRFLFLIAKPVFNKSATCSEFLLQLQESTLQGFDVVMEEIYTSHKYGNTYVLSENALHEYNKMTDSYAEYINDKYGSDNEDNGENSFTDSQPNSNLVTSKDTQHILRLAAILHILHQRVNPILLQTGTEESSVIPKLRLQQASKLYFTLQQHKDTFVQGSMDTVKNKIKLKPVKTFQERVVKAVCIFPGPFVLQRSIQRHIKGALADNIKNEFQYLERNGFGTIKVIHNRPYFMKVPAQCIDEEVGSQLQIMRSAGINLQEYDRAFINTAKMQEDDRAICRLHHPQAEIIMDLHIV